MAGCGPTVTPASESPPAIAPVLVPNVKAHLGQSYIQLTQVIPQYSPENLGLADVDVARLTQAMATSTPAWLASGGGAEAVVFAGCAAEGCATGQGVVAVDVATGGVFVGVHDAAGAAELSVNDRVEALLRLNAPNGSWEDARPEAAPATAAP
jgi:hypothetical protein